MEGDSAEIGIEIDNFAREFGARIPFEVAQLYAMNGNVDTAFNSLQQATQQTPRMEIALHTLSPFLSGLHDDPRWQEILEIAGVADHQLAAIEFDPQLPR